MRSGQLIENLVAGLEPVRPIRAPSAIAAPFLTMALIALVLALVFGLRADLMAGEPHPMFLIRGGTLLLLGAAATSAAIAMARPAVGAFSNGWLWALGAALLFPVSAAGVAMTRGAPPMSALAPIYGAECIVLSLASALAIGASIVLTLRRGAPTCLARAGWLTGLAAGSLGAFGYSLFCPFNSVIYIGLWYSIAVGGAALIGRLAVPRLVRW